MTAQDGGASAFERLAGELDYPMFVVTTADATMRAGCLVGFATQTSIEPVRFLVCLSDKNQTYRVASSARRLVVHLLSRQQVELARLFGHRSGDDADKFSRCSWHLDAHGIPVLDEVPAWFAGPIVERRRLGDHVGFLIEPDDGVCAGAQRDDLVTFVDVAGLEPGHDA